MLTLLKLPMLDFLLVFVEIVSPFIVIRSSRMVLMWISYTAHLKSHYPGHRIKHNHKILVVENGILLLWLSRFAVRKVFSSVSYFFSPVLESRNTVLCCASSRLKDENFEKLFLFERSGKKEQTLGKNFEQGPYIWKKTYFGSV